MRGVKMTEPRVIRDSEQSPGPKLRVGDRAYVRDRNSQWLAHVGRVVEVDPLTRNFTGTGYRVVLTFDGWKFVLFYSDELLKCSR